MLHTAVVFKRRGVTCMVLPPGGDSLVVEVESAGEGLEETSHWSESLRL